MGTGQGVICLNVARRTTPTPEELGAAGLDSGKLWTLESAIVGWVWALLLSCWHWTDMVLRETKSPVCLVGQRATKATVGHMSFLSPPGWAAWAGVPGLMG